MEIKSSGPARKEHVRDATDSGHDENHRGPTIRHVTVERDCTARRADRRQNARQIDIKFDNKRRHIETNMSQRAGCFKLASQLLGEGRTNEIGGGEKDKSCPSRPDADAGTYDDGLRFFIFFSYSKFLFGRLLFYYEWYVSIVLPVLFFIYVHRPKLSLNDGSLSLGQSVKV